MRTFHNMVRYERSPQHNNLEFEEIGMNEKIYQGLVLLGKMPVQDFENSSPAMEKLANQFRVLLEMKDVITIDEAKFLISILPKRHFYDLEWSILSLVESIVLQDDNDKQAYEKLIQSCTNEEIKSNLLAGYENWKELCQ